MDWVSNIFSFSLGAVTIGAIVYFLFKKTAENFISNHFQKQLEEYRHQLNYIAEEKRFDFQRMLNDFSQYSSKRHEVYPELYKLLLETKRIAIECTEIRD
jgi:dsRNA-specific ribonuclease